LGNADYERKDCDKLGEFFELKIEGMRIEDCEMK
jgi:hypothetical protein